MPFQSSAPAVRRVFDEGVALPYRSGLNFAGSGVSVADTGSAVQVTVPNLNTGGLGKTSGVINVLRDYGPMVANMTTRIQAALNDAPVGGTLLFPLGSYYTDTVYVDPAKHLRLTAGAGLIYFNRFTTGVVGTPLMVIDGSGSSTPTLSKTLIEGFVFYGVDGIGYGLHLNAIQGATVSNCRVEGCNQGFYAQSTTACDFDLLYCVSCPGAGLRFVKVNAADLDVRDNTVSCSVFAASSTGNGIKHSGGGGLRVSDCDFEGLGLGVAVGHPYGAGVAYTYDAPLVFDSCWFEGNAAGIQIADEAPLVILDEMYGQDGGGAVVVNPGATNFSEVRTNPTIFRRGRFQPDPATGQIWSTLAGTHGEIRFRQNQSPTTGVLYQDVSSATPAPVLTDNFTP